MSSSYLGKNEILEILPHLKTLNFVSLTKHKIKIINPLSRCKDLDGPNVPELLSK